MKNIINMKRTQRKAFSLVELVVVILIIAILAVAVFAGGSAAIKKSQVSRTTSDLHNFSVAIESAVNQTPKVANMLSNAEFKSIVDAVNANLPSDYQLSIQSTEISGKNLNVTVDAKNAAGEASPAGGAGTYLIYKSTKTDAWDNPYYVIFDCGERHAKGQSDFYITVVSAGPNSQTNVGGNIEADDIFLLTQYSDGDVSAVTYNCAEGGLKITTAVNEANTPSYTLNNFDAKVKADGTANTTALNTLVTKGNGGTMKYAGGENNKSYTTAQLPVNF